jgi:hypothetical protein
MTSKEESIKLVLKTCYSQQRYNKEQLPTLINNIIDTITNECYDIINIDDIINTLVLYIHMNKDQLYFIDTNRRREKLFDKYDTLFRKFVLINPKSKHNETNDNELTHTYNYK